MIWLTRLNRVPFVVNAELISHMEVTPDTVIFLTDGQKIVVLEQADEVIDKVTQYRRSILRGPLYRKASDQTAVQRNGRVESHGGEG